MIQIVQLSSSDIGPEIKRFGIKTVEIYDVTNEELEQIENGLPYSIYLNFSISLLSMAVPSIFSLLTTQINNLEIMIIFYCFTICCIILGLIFLIIWFINRKKLPSVIKKIRERKLSENDVLKNEELKK